MLTYQVTARFPQMAATSVGTKRDDCLLILFGAAAYMRGCTLGH